MKPELQPVKMTYDVIFRPKRCELYITRSAAAKHFQKPFVQLSYDPETCAVGLTPTDARNGGQSVWRQSRQTACVVLGAFLKTVGLPKPRNFAAHLQQLDDGTLYFLIPEWAMNGKEKANV